VAGDEIYGDSIELRDLIASHGRWYVLAVRTPVAVWTARPPLVAPEPQDRGRPRTQVRLADGAVPGSTVKEVVARWRASHWQSLAVAEGDKGLITYDWACQRVIESRDGLPGPEAWLIGHRSLGDPREIAYYLSNAPADTPLLKLAQEASLRYTVEQCLEEAKSETGLDEYEVRYWQSWYRHKTLSMMAHAWLASIRCKATEKKGGLSPSWLS
jgi:SRSO17 transposase